MIIADRRRIRVKRVVVVDNELKQEQGAEFWQDEHGNVKSAGLWADLLVPMPEDLAAQAAAKGISSVEWLRLRLSRAPYLQVEVSADA